MMETEGWNNPVGISKNYKQYNQKIPEWIDNDYRDKQMKALIGGKYLSTYMKDNSIDPADQKKIEFLLASDDFTIPGLLAQAAPLVMKYGPIVANWLGTRMSDQLK